MAVCFEGHGFINDITQRKHAEKALRESEDQLRSFAQLAPVGICRTDVKGRALYVNERWCEITGRMQVWKRSARTGACDVASRRSHRKVFEGVGGVDARRQEESSLEYRFLHCAPCVVWGLREQHHLAARRQCKGKRTGYCSAP